MLQGPRFEIPCRRESVVTVFAARASTTVIRFGRYGRKRAHSRTPGSSVSCVESATTGHVSEEMLCIRAHACTFGQLPCSAKTQYFRLLLAVCLRVEPVH